MASKHVEAISVLLQLSGADKVNGITVNDIQLKSDIPRASIFRVLSSEADGFFKSRYPSRPQGYYFNEDLAAETLNQRINNSVTNMVSMDRANKLLARAEKVNASITPIGKHFCHIKLSDKELEKKLLDALNGEPTKSTWMDICKAILNTTEKDKRIAKLLIAIQRVEANAILPKKEES